MKQINRILLYFAGLFIIALGINLAILSNLGVSPVSAFTVPLSEAVNIDLGTVTAVCYAGFVLIEIFEKAYGPLKILTDCIFVALGILVSLACLGGISAIREGTILSALVTGKMTGIFLSHWKAPLQKIAFEQQYQLQKESVPASGKRAG